jgi:PAS domain S-box-containing protein
MNVVSSPSSSAQSHPVRRSARTIASNLLLHRSASVLLSLLIVIVGATLTLTNWMNLQRREAATLDRALAHRAESIQAAIRDRMLTYQAVLHSAAGLVHASDVVTENEWRIFTDQLRIAASYPGLLGLGYAPRLPPEAVDGERDRFPVLYLEPPNERNRRLMGFDLMSEPKHRRAMERARDSGNAALTSKITLLRTIDGMTEPGFLVFFPVYTHGHPPVSVRERRERLIAYIYTPFQAKTFIESVLGGLPGDLALQVRDADAAEDDVLLYQHGADTASLFSRERSVSMLGHRWQIRVGARPAFVHQQRSSEPMWTLVAGGTTTLLVAALVFTLAIARQNLANRLKAELLVRERDRHAAAILNNSLDAYVSIDDQDRIVAWNRQAEITFGWAASAVLGRRLAETVIPERHRAQHLKALRTYASREPKLVGKRIEMPATRADGREVTVELSIIAVPGKDSLSFVASMRDVTEVRRQQAELLRMNATLEHRVEERTAALAAANHSLQSANEQLEAFAQNVSHDLRAPLRAIHGYTSIVLSNCNGLDPTSRSHLATVEHSAKSMQRIIDDLLRLARVRQQPVQKQRVNMWALILDVIRDIGGSKPPTIQATPDDLGEVLADPGLLSQALRNLVSNAIKFTAPVADPKIAFGCEVTNGERAFYIKDNGVGFDPRYADNLFRAFGRLHSGETFEGTGIGLTIVKTIVERHGGRIWATSPPGEGATFWFTLP